MKSIYLWLLMLLPAACSAQAITPYVINSSGGAFRQGYYQLEWSIGEMALTSQMQATSNNLITTNGFLQPYTLYPSKIFPGVLFQPDEIRVFPNPAKTFVEINFFTRQRGLVILRFYDAAGKNVYTDQLTCYGVDLIHTIPVSKFASGAYMLHISLDAFPGHTSKRGAYQIIKIQ